MIHERVDIERWKAMFPLSGLREEARRFVLRRQAEQPEAYHNDEAIRDHIQLMSPGGERITSPHDLAVVELLREEAFNATGLCAESQERVPIDVFVFAKGEPERREVTKVGGAPYWPADRGWPSGSTGSPLQFAFQICFADSRDLFSNLTGDVLVAFVDTECLWADHSRETPQSSLQFHWLPLGVDRLIDPAIVPTGDLACDPCYGAIHRTWDYPKIEEPFQHLNSPWYLPVIEGTKIGGVPRWIQYEPERWGRHLCVSGSIEPAMSQPYPWLNDAAPISDFQEYPDNTLGWDDAGSLYMCLTPDGSVRWEMQGY
jgi:hypothetical protein